MVETKKSHYAIMLAPFFVAAGLTLVIAPRVHLQLGEAAAIATGMIVSGLVLVFRVKPHDKRHHTVQLFDKTSEAVFIHLSGFRDEGISGRTIVDQLGLPESQVRQALAALSDQRYIEHHLADPSANDLLDLTWVVPRS